jgi:MvaI/BcnI restriction endonuclease family
MALPKIDLKRELSKLKALGWIPSNRKSDTGIGKTLEDKLGIPENNSGEPDCIYGGLEVEVKSHRITSGAMITLFTLEPGKRELKDVALIEKYGYINGNGRKALKVTLKTDDFNQQGIKLESSKAKGTISIVDSRGYAPWVWTTADIHLKLHNLCIVYCDSKKENGQEYFRINNAKLAIGLDDACFFRLVSKGLIKVDLRMHIKSTGASRNHGTGFRLSSWDDLIQCYEKVIDLV